MIMVDDDVKEFVIADTTLPIYWSGKAKTALPQSNLLRSEKKLSKFQRIRSSRPASFLILAFVFFFCLTCYQLINCSPWRILTDKLMMGAPRTNDLTSESEPILIKDLPSIYLPTTGKNRTPRRLIVIGDIHGMKHSFQHLLDKVKFNQTVDHLVLVGDLVSKGPDSAGVVDMAMKLGATCVRGNHEDRAIKAWDNLQANEFLGENLHTDKSKNSDHRKDKNLAKSLGEGRIAWLKTFPTILRLGKMGSMGHVLVAHAGIQPGVALEDQNSFLVMNMRSYKHGVFTEKHKGKVWTKKWNKFQKSLHPDKRTTIIYGHDAKRGLRMKSYSMGIDSGCFKGKKLTAVVIEGDEFSFTHELVRVKCKKP